MTKKELFKLFTEFTNDQDDTNKNEYYETRKDIVLDVMENFYDFLCDKEHKKRSVKHD